MSGARPAPWTDSREHRDTWSRQTAAAPPPTGTTVFSGETLNRPLGSLRPGLHGLPALSGVLAPPCVTVRPGMSAFSRDLYFWTGRTNPPSAQIRGRGPELPLNRHGHVIERLLGLDAIAPSPGCGSPGGGLYCRLGAHRRPMPGGRLVLTDCSSACRSLTLFELRATFLYGHTARADVERHMLRSTKNGSRTRRFPFANSSCHPWRDLRVPAMMDVSGVLANSAQLAGRIASW